MPNRLAGETSPYLLQHAHTPVDWYPWGPEALAKAKSEDKPIFLSIGYAACHWCHVMERESFEDAATAADLNRDFVGWFAYAPLSNAPFSANGAAFITQGTQAGLAIMGAGLLVLAFWAGYRVGVKGSPAGSGNT